MSPDYSQEPENADRFTAAFDRFYTRFAPAYDQLVWRLPTWRTWIESALPYLQGPRILEVSFGTGYLMTRYAQHFETYGADYNARMVATAQQNLDRQGLSAGLLRADVVYLPFAGNTMDSVVNTMAFSGYPHAQHALAEIGRVLKPGGRLIIVDINYPRDGNWPGNALTRFWANSGDLIRDMDALLQTAGWIYTDTEVGGFGSVHLYVAEKRS